MQLKRTAFLAGAAGLAPFALADDTVAEISRPNFTPTSLKAPFLEQFTDDWETRWKISQAKRVNDKSTEEEWAYVGKWAVEEPTVYKGINGDKGLILKDAAAHHAISAKFPSVIDPKGKDLVVQYEVKLQNGLECGGAYLKLLQENTALHADEFSNAAPYVIMFGPDKCGSTNKVHFIFKHKNPVTGDYEEKHLSQNVAMNNTKQSTLYGLHVKADNSFTLKINGEDKATGSLLEDFTPEVNPAKEIDDPEDTKPADWIDAAKIADPEATKPEDWDEDAPFQIVDETAEKPADWLENEPQMVPDPEAEKPEDWDDEEDGDWVPPMVPNPKCADASGCGPWEKPMIKNPEYKGKWKAAMIDNPAYKGVWKPRLVANPGYFEDNTPANFEPIGGIGFEIWTMQGNILFDNIYVGHSAADAEKLKAETFDIKKPIEEAEENATKPAVDDEDVTTPDAVKSPLDLQFSADPVHYIREKVQLFFTLAMKNPVDAFKFVPEVGGAIVAGVIGVLILLFGGFGAAAASPQGQQAANKVKAAASNASAKTAELKDQAADVVNTAAENTRAEANKRTTRSSGAADGVTH